MTLFLDPFPVNKKTRNKKIVCQSMVTSWKIEFSALSYEIFISHILTPSTEVRASPTAVPLALGSVSKEPSVQALVSHLNLCQ